MRDETAATVACTLLLCTVSFFIGHFLGFKMAKEVVVPKEYQQGYRKGYEEGALAATAIHEENCPKKEYECTLERMPDWTTGWVCREASNGKTVEEGTNNED